MKDKKVLDPKLDHDSDYVDGDIVKHKTVKKEGFTPKYSFSEFVLEEKKKKKESMKDDGNTQIEVNPEIDTIGK